MGIRSSKNTQKQQKTPNPIITYQNMVKVINQYSINKQYEFLNVIGKGTYAQVYRAKAIQTQNIRAIKKIDRNKNPKISSMLINQFDILKQCDHPNILKMYQLFQDYHNFYIVSQLCNGTELYDAIKQAKSFSQLQTCQILYQIVSAVSYLHNLKIMHRDLKPENMMYDRETKIIKLIDFGTAIRFQTSEVTHRKCIGTSYYVAPQVLNKCYNQKCDVWSLGVIFYILLSGKPPFSGKSDEEIMKKILQNQVAFTHQEWKVVSSEAKALIKKMLTKQIKKRPSINQVMADPWFKETLKTDLVYCQIPYMVQCLQNMKKFEAMKTNKIQQGMLIFIASFIKNTEDQVILWKCFNQIDKNRDGSINHLQLKQAFKDFLRMNEKDALNLSKCVFDKVDFNKSNAIDYSEFMIAAINLELAVNDRNLDIAFDYIDSDGSGKLDVQEIRKKLGQNLDINVYKKLIKQFDVNGDGQIDRDQFKQMMKKLLDSYNMTP